MHLFVYYKLIPSAFPDLHRKIEVLQEELKASFPELKSKFLKRPATDDQGRETWLEIYEFNKEDYETFSEKLNSALANIAFDPARLNEVFVDF